MSNTDARLSTDEDFMGAPPVQGSDRDDAADKARAIIRTWTRGLITLAEMVTELQKVADSEHRKSLIAGAELAARRRREASGAGPRG